MTATATPADTLNILVADNLAPAGVEFLQSQDGVSVDVKTGLSEDELAAIIPEYDGLLVRSGAQVTAKCLANPGRLRCIARAGVGVDNIDLDAATSAGVLVMNSADASTTTTAEHAFALLMALARNIGPAYKTMTEGGWDRKKFTGVELRGKTLGVVGLGRIGATVAERALAFGMTVLAFDPVYKAETALDGRVKLVPTFDELIEQIDVVSFHVPLNDHTRDMLSTEQFAKAKPNLLVVNAARGGIVNVDALIAAVENGQCAGAALDVYEKEPLEEDSPLRNQPKILLTPHLGASTKEAQDAVSNHACDQVLEYLRGEGIRGAVNVAGFRLDLDDTSRAFIDLAQRMGKLIAPMADQGIGDVTVTCKGDALNAAASTIERCVLVELLNEVMDEPVNVVNAKPIAESRGIKVRSVLESDPGAHPRLIIEIAGGDSVRRIVGSVFNDGLPRVLEISGYHMDLVPVGPIVVIQNEDRPGMVGLVGGEFGDAEVNIADLALSRRGETALMVLKLDTPLDDAMLNRLRARPGILKVATPCLPPLA